MSLTKNELNKEAVMTFLHFNNIEPNNAMAYNKFETAYYEGEHRIFREQTAVIFNTLKSNDMDVILPEVNSVEFQTVFKTAEEDFYFDDDNDTLSITNEEYKVVISSAYLDF